MALSYNFFPDRDTIIKAALRRIRAYDPEDATTITTVQYTNAAETLNFILSHWQALGLPIWCHKSTSKALTASDGTYTVGSGADINVNKPFAIIKAWLRDTDNNDTILELVGQDEYYDTANKQQTGTPLTLFYDPNYDGSSNQGATSTGTIYLWPIPDTTAASEYTLHFIYQRPLLDYNASTDNLDMPQEWYEAVRLQLAYKIAPEYGLPVMELDRLKKDAQEALELAFTWDSQMEPIKFSPEYPR